jgi:hypothetical protein
VRRARPGRTWRRRAPRPLPRRRRCDARPGSPGARPSAPLRRPSKAAPAGTPPSLRGRGPGGAQLFPSGGIASKRRRRLSPGRPQGELPPRRQPQRAVLCLSSASLRSTGLPRTRPRTDRRPVAVLHRKAQTPALGEWPLAVPATTVWFGDGTRRARAPLRQVFSAQPPRAGPRVSLTIHPATDGPARRLDGTGQRGRRDTVGKPSTLPRLPRRGRSSAHRGTASGRPAHAGGPRWRRRVLRAQRTAAPCPAPGAGKRYSRPPRGGRPARAGAPTNRRINRLRGGVACISSGRPNLVCEARIDGHVAAPAAADAFMRYSWHRPGRRTTPNSGAARSARL